MENRTVSTSDWLTEDFVLTAFEFFNTTLEDEANYFTGELAPWRAAAGEAFWNFEGGLEDGTYRVLDGELYRLVDDKAPGGIEQPNGK